MGDKEGGFHPEFRKWLAIQIEEHGQKGFAKLLGLSPEAVSEWVRGNVARVGDESAISLARYMRQLPADRRMVAIVRDDIRLFMRDGVKPGAKLSDLRIVPSPLVFEWVADADTLDLIEANRLISEEIQDRLSPDRGSVRVRAFLRGVLSTAGFEPTDSEALCGQFWKTKGEQLLARRILAGSVFITPDLFKELAILADALSDDLITAETLAEIYQPSPIQSIDPE